MDERRSLKIPAIFCRLRKSASHLLLGLGALAACMSSATTITVPSPDAFAQLTKSVAEWRELPLHGALRLEVRTAQDSKIPPRLAPANDSSVVPISQVEWVYKSIGLLPNDVDLADALTEYERILQLISYNRADGVVRLSPAAGRLGAPLEKVNPVASRELPAALAIARALQDQRFAWREKIATALFEDRRAALRAVEAGDALLMTVSHAARPARRKLSAAQMEAMLQVAGEIDKLAARLPSFLRELISFPYRDGSQYVNWAFAASGWSGVDSLYADPPTTTAQILHPEKYFLQREQPLRFFPVVLLRRFNHRPIVEQSLGELLIRTLLRSAHSPKSAAEIASGWRGDQLFSFRKDDLFYIFWFSAWPNERSAGEFIEAYGNVIERRQGVRFDNLGQAESRTKVAAQRDGRGWLLQPRGSSVLVLHASGNGLTELAEEAWRDLEIEPETPVFRFESARRWVNFR